LDVIRIGQLSRTFETSFFTFWLWIWIAHRTCFTWQRLKLICNDGGRTWRTERRKRANCYSPYLATAESQIRVAFGSDHFDYSAYINRKSNFLLQVRKCSNDKIAYLVWHRNTLLLTCFASPTRS
jgi:hypothetical protein